ncbi:hypothetical protein F4779DRAFT_261261 [Xylariaceae sp. FL0662B]|nr:hypothetical protein F4779DRAFT_261261 [Xylariaceae sp. FL0662B]
MAQNQASQPGPEYRVDEPELSPMDNPAVTSRDAHTPVTTMPDQPQLPLDDGEARPPLPNRPIPSPVTHPSYSHPNPAPQPYQQPYPPYAYSYGQPVRALPPYSKPWTVSKLTLTILSLGFAIVIMALSFIFVAEGGDGEYTSWYALPISIIAIIWNTAELITFCVRARKKVNRGIHPGAHVGMHLCFWLACVSALVITFIVYFSILDQALECQEVAEYNKYSGSTYYTVACDDYHYDVAGYMSGLYLPSLRAAISMWCLAFVVHFILFIMACIDTHKRNLIKATRLFVPAPSAPAAYYAVPPPPPAPTPYYPYPTPMPMPPQQAHFVHQPGIAVTPPPPENPQATGVLDNTQGFYAPTGPAQAATSSSSGKDTPTAVAHAV